MQDRPPEPTPDAATRERARGRTPEGTPQATPGRRRLGAIALPVVIFLAMAALFAVALQKGDPSKVPSALIGRPAPQLVLAPVEGLAVAGKPLRGLAAADVAGGRPVVVNFWASWCLPCVDEHPHLVALVQRTGVTLLGINHKDQPSNAIRFLERHGNPYAAIGTDANGRAAIEWGVYGMPETFVVDAAGKVAFKHVGPITAETLERQIIPALEKASLRR